MSYLFTLSALAVSFFFLYLAFTEKEITDSIIAEVLGLTIGMLSFLVPMAWPF